MMSKGKMGQVAIMTLLLVPLSQIVAEATGFMIPKGQTENQVEEISQRKAGETDTDGAEFIRNYADREEITRLRLMLVKRNQEVARLKESLELVKKQNQELQVRSQYRQENEAFFYEVRKKDNLWKIAKKKEIYANASLWIKIYNANMDRIKNPNVIYPGQLLRIPKG